MAARLRARSVPIVFATGCQELLLVPAYLGAPALSQANGQVGIRPCCCW